MSHPANASRTSKHPFRRVHRALPASASNASVSGRLPASAFASILAVVLAAAALFAAVLLTPPCPVAAAGPVEGASPYRVLAPIESGNLLLFPVVAANGRTVTGTPFLTLDEGLKAGSVEVTEAGRVRGLVRPRNEGPIPHPYGGDQVNTLVLLNNSDKPLILLAGEVVTGGKQDRVIAKDRIVPPGANPIDLSVFCIEPGRWTESSPVFGASSKAPTAGFMVQPTIREQAMAAKNQQQVWNSVHGAIAALDAAPAPSGGPVLTRHPLETSSYAKAMQSSDVQAKVDEAAAPLTSSREQILTQLRKEGAIGVVVAVRGEIVWADLFASTDLLSRYWTKLVRSYAAESLNPGDSHPTPTVADAQRFLEVPAGGTETSEGTVGVYRYSELKRDGTETFVLQSLLPNADYEVHLSKLKLRHVQPGAIMPLGDPLPPRPRPELRLLPLQPQFK
jgi:hypothetical protein